MGLLENLPHTATIKIRVNANDGLAGTKATPRTVATGVSCWLQPASDSQIIESGKRKQRVTHKVYFAENPNVDERHILIINGETMDVRSTAQPDASAGLGVLFRVMVEKWTR